jgi:hypothetical protein
MPLRRIIVAPRQFFRDVPSVTQTDLQAIEEARRAGIDVDMLDTILGLSLEQRLHHHDGALDVVLELRKARIARDAKFCPAAATAR